MTPQEILKFRADQPEAWAVMSPNGSAVLDALTAAEMIRRGSYQQAKEKLQSAIANLDWIERNWK